MLFIIASVQALPRELNGLVSHVSINFPWGSLLDSLLADGSGLFGGLASLSQSVTSFDIRLNGGAMTEGGWTLKTGAEQIYNNLIDVGWQVNTLAVMDARTLQSFPSSWAKRLAFGRDPHAVVMSGWFSSPS